MSRKIIKIPLSVVCKRLAKATEYDFRMNHLAVLIHCWRKRHPDEAPDVHTLCQRKKKSSEAWLTRDEIVHLGEYAGYDISSG